MDGLISSSYLASKSCRHLTSKLKLHYLNSTLHRAQLWAVDASEICKYVKTPLKLQNICTQTPDFSISPRVTGIQHELYAASVVGTSRFSATKSGLPCGQTSAVKHSAVTEVPLCITYTIASGLKIPEESPKL